MLIYVQHTGMTIDGDYHNAVRKISGNIERNSKIVDSVFKDANDGNKVWVITQNNNQTMNLYQILDRCNPGTVLDLSSCGIDTLDNLDTVVSDYNVVVVNTNVFQFLLESKYIRNIRGFTVHIAGPASYQTYVNLCISNCQVVHVYRDNNEVLNKVLDRDLSAANSMSGVKIFDETQPENKYE